MNVVKFQEFKFLEVEWYPLYAPKSLFQLGFFMFSFKNSTLPSKFINLFFINSQIHNYHTRNAHSFRLPLCRTNTRLFSIYFQGPKFYNSLNSVITGSSSSASFKRKLKDVLLSMYQRFFCCMAIIRLFVKYIYGWVGVCVCVLCLSQGLINIKTYLF